MVWTPNDVCSIQQAVAQVYSEFAETVYVRRLVPDGAANETYQEDPTKTELEFRVLAVVQQNPSLRLLSKYGRKEPVDLILSFSQVNLTAAGLPNGIENDDVIIYRGVRHVVVKTNDRVKIVTNVDVNSPCADATSADQAAQDLLFWAMAVLSSNKNLLVTTEAQPSQPTITGAAISLLTPTLVNVTFSRDVHAVGVPMRRVRVKVNGEVARQQSLVVSGLAMTVELEVAVVGGQSVTLTYIPYAKRPVIDGIDADDNEEELAAVTDMEVGVS